RLVRLLWRAFPPVPSALLLAAKQGLLRVLFRQRNNRLCQLHTALAATHEANVAEIVASISLKRLDFRPVVGSYHLVPVQPKLPAIGHGIAHLHVHDACPFPVPAPPIRRMQAPEILGPPLTKMLGRRPLDFSHQPGTRYSHRSARLH